EHLSQKAGGGIRAAGQLVVAQGHPNTRVACGKPRYKCIRHAPRIEITEHEPIAMLWVNYRGRMLCRDYAAVVLVRHTRDGLMKENDVTRLRIGQNVAGCAAPIFAKDVEVLLIERSNTVQRK